MFIETF